jgi:hypothetical protein
MKTDELDTEKDSRVEAFCIWLCDEKSQDNKGETVSCRVKQRKNYRNFQRGTGHLEIGKTEYHKIK